MYSPQRSDGDLLVERHLDLVRRIAYHMLARLPASVQADDLIQAGMIGLLEAARHFEEGHGASFETFAGIRIRGAMLDEVRRHDWAPRSTHRDGRRVAEAIRVVEGRIGREAGPKEIAAEMGVDLVTYQKLLQRVTETRVLSLESLFGTDTDYADTLEGSSADPFGELVRGDFVAATSAAVAELPEREQLVLSLYYDDELNLKEIGEVLGVTESRVCQIHGQALSRLRGRLVDWSQARLAD